MKSVIKEILITLLILIAIVLILVIILYDYNPTNKTIPEKVAEYTLPPDVETELSKEVKTGTQNIVETYRIEEQDLNGYEKTNEYDRGKINPFKFSETNVVTGTNETTGLLNTTIK